MGHVQVSIQAWERRTSTEKEREKFLAYMQSLKKVTEEEGPPKTWGYFYEKVHSCDEFCIPKVPQLGRQPV